MFPSFLWIIVIGTTQRNTNKYNAKNKRNFGAINGRNMMGATWWGQRSNDETRMDDGVGLFGRNSGFWGGHISGRSFNWVLRPFGRRCRPLSNKITYHGSHQRFKSNIPTTTFHEAEPSEPSAKPLSKYSADGATFLGFCNTMRRWTELPI